MKSHLCLNLLVSVVLDDHLWHAADESHAHLWRVVGAEWRERAAAAVHLGREQVVQLRLMVRTLKTVTWSGYGQSSNQRVFTTDTNITTYM